MADEARTTEPVGTSTGGVLAEVTAEIVAAYVTHNHVQAGDVPGLIVAVHAALDGVVRPTRPDAAPSRPTPPVPIRKTVTDEHIISLEDGRPYQTLKKHLTKRGLTPEGYREKWGLPNDYPMVAPGYARARSALAKEIGLGSMRRKGPARPQA